MDESSNSGVTTDSPAVSAQTSATTVSEDVTNAAGGSQEQTIPFTRFQEVNDKAKAAEERAAKAEQEAEALRQQTQSRSSNTDDEDDIDPNVQNLVTKIIEKQGYVKKDAVDQAVSAAELRRQYMEDIGSLTSQYAKTGIPFVEADVRKFARENGVNITNKTSLEAAYRQMNNDKILEAARNAAIAEFKEGGKLAGEKPGSTGAQKPEEPEVHGLKNRISAARTRLTR